MSGSEHDIPTDTFLALHRFVEDRLGLAYPPEKHRDLARGLHATLRDLGLNSAADLERRIRTSSSENSAVAGLIRNLTVGETYFFRESATIDALREHLFPEILARKRGTDRSIRIWSAGCCTGEEPYTLAILLHRLLGAATRDWRISITATDVNNFFLEKARAGIYRPWSFRSPPKWLIPEYFRDLGNTFELSPAIRSMVTFMHLNLAAEHNEASAFHDMDLILCRNVLMYFSAGKALRALKLLHRSLAPEGHFFVGASEGSIPSESGLFRPRYLGEVIAYRRSTAGDAPPAGPGIDKSVTAAFPTPESGPEPARTDWHPAPPLPEPDHPAPGTGERAAELAETARQLADSGELEEAVAACEAAIAKDRLDPSHQHLLATILLELGRDEHALAALTRAIYLDSDFALAYFQKAVLLRKAGRDRDGRKQLENALASLRALEPDDEVPHSDGMTAGRLREIIQAMLED